MIIAINIEKLFYKIYHFFIISILSRLELVKSDKGNSQNNLQRISYLMISH